MEQKKANVKQQLNTFKLSEGDRQEDTFLMQEGLLYPAPKHGTCFVLDTEDVDMEKSNIAAVKLHTFSF